jgi:hypothetical protein
MHNEYDLRRLVTRQDKLFMHKLLGVASVLSFFYRYAYVYTSAGNLGFESRTRFNTATMALHSTLSATGLFFTVPKNRLKNKPFIVYEEYLYHAVVFTSRCLFVYLSDNKAVVVLLHHIVADLITKLFGNGSTAVRANVSTKKYRKIALCYSYYQFLAIGSHLFSNNLEAGWNALVAIQSSVFLMTLYKKKIIRGIVHRVVYSLCLCLSGFHIYKDLSTKAHLLVLCVFLLRIKWNINKYTLWGIAYTLFVAFSDYV